MNERNRLRTLTGMGILDVEEDPYLDTLVQTVRRMFDAPYAFITLIGEERVWLRAGHGNLVTEVPREHAFCNYTILHDTVLVVPDARADPNFARNPYVTGDPGVRFYAGAPLTIAPGTRLGALCIVDTELRHFDERDMDCLLGLARLAVGELWLRHASDAGWTASDRTALLSLARHDLTPSTDLSGAQIRAGRALLDWTMERLSIASGVSTTTIKRMEANHATLKTRSDSVSLVRSALEGAGIFFIGTSGVSANSTKS